MSVENPRQDTDLAGATLARVPARGNGTRRGELTLWHRKPSIRFTRCLRNIGFTLSYCVNSGVRRNVVRNMEFWSVQQRRHGPCGCVPVPLAPCRPCGILSATPAHGFGGDILPVCENPAAAQPFAGTWDGYGLGGCGQAHRERLAPGPPFPLHDPACPILSHGEPLAGEGNLAHETVRLPGLRVGAKCRRRAAAGRGLSIPGGTPVGWQQRPEARHNAPARVTPGHAGASLRGCA
jgi:hypothetical protein